MSQGRMARKVTAAVAFSLLLVGCGSSSESSSRPEVLVDYPFYESAEALTEAADLVVVGTAVDSREDTVLPSYEGDDPEQNPRAGMEQLSGEELEAAAVPVTVSIVRIDEVVVGAAEAGGLIEVSQVTGEVGSPIEEGPVLLFLSGEDAHLSIVGGSQGHWVEEDGGFRAVAADRSDLMLSAADVAGLA